MNGRKPPHKGLHGALMVDRPGTGTTVRAMTTDSILVVLGSISILAILTVGIRSIRPRRSAPDTAKTSAAGERPESRTGGEEQSSGGTRDPRVERVSEAYANGEIDERMLTTAARALGIEKEEARRRLEGAATAHGTATTGEREKQRAQARAKNRKKNKQAKRSRQANRR